MDTPSSASAERPRALFLSPESPYPMVGGGPLRSASLLEFLRERYLVDAIVFHQEGDPDPSKAFGAGRVENLEVLELPRHSKTGAARAARNSLRMFRNRPPLVDRFSGFHGAIAKLAARRRYDVAIVEHFWCAPYVAEIRGNARLVILDLHNIESAWHHSLADAETGARAFALKRFAVISADLERRWLPAFDHLLVTSEDDAAVVKRIAPGVNVTVYPNALPVIAPPPRQELDEIVFSGNLEYAPNILAVRFFKDRIWPALRPQWPNLVWKIVGKNAEAVRGFVQDDSRIQLTGCVDDAVLALAGAKVAVVPVQAGSGTRIKILEAWAAETAVVSTTLGAQGLDCRDGEHLLLADAPGKFAEAVSQLLASGEFRRQIGSAGRKLYEERFTWPVAWRRLQRIFGNGKLY